MKRSYGYMLLIRGFAALAMFASQVIPARCLDVDQFGDFSYITSLLTVLTFIVIWGTDRYSMKVFSLRNVNASSGETPKFNVFGVYSVIIINTLLAGVFLYYYLPNHLGEGYSLPLLFLSVLALFGRSIARVSSSITRGLGNVLISEFVFSFTRPLLFSFFVILYYFGFGKINYFEVLFLFALAYISVFLITSIKNTLKVGVIKNPKISQIPNIYKFSFFFFLVGVGMPLMTNINTIQLGNMMASEDVAMFSAAVKIVSVVALGLVSANLLISPKLSPLFYSGKLDEMHNLIRKNNAFVASITVLPIVLIAIFSEQVLTIYGDAYVEAAKLLRILVIGQAINVFCGPALLVATMTGLQKSASLVVLAMALINWFLCLLLIPKFGTEGAAYASVLVGILLKIALVIIIYRRTSLNVTMLNLLKKHYDN